MGGEHRRRWVMYRANQDVGSDLLTLANAEAIAVQRKYKSASAQQAADLPGVAPSIQCNMLWQEHSLPTRRAWGTEE